MKAPKPELLNDNWLPNIREAVSKKICVICVICDEDRYRADAEKALRQLCVDYKENYTGIDNCYRVGVPCEEIAAAAKELKSDLIIISTHKYHWFDHLINGGDAERIVRRVSCPILVVPQDRN